MDAPGLWGVFVGNMFDSGSAKPASGGTMSGSQVVGTQRGAGGIDDRGLVTFDRKDRKDAFWLYKAGWNTSEPFVRIAGSRLGSRSERRQTIHVYSNLPEVELFVGGRSQGHRTGERGIFVWDNINMRSGANRIEARATGAVAGNSGDPDQASDRAGSVTVTDRASIYIVPNTGAASRSDTEATASGKTTTPVNAIIQ
jgi:beta-galactosidase